MVLLIAITLSLVHKLIASRCLSRIDIAIRLNLKTSRGSQLH